jgi:hypothetical protein
VLQRVSASGGTAEPATVLDPVPGHRFVDDWSPDGRMMAVHTSTQETTLDAWIVPLDDHKPNRLKPRKLCAQTGAQMAPFAGDWLLGDAIESHKRQAAYTRRRSVGSTLGGCSLRNLAAAQPAT